MRRVVAVKALPDYRVWLKYDNGVEGTVDLSDLGGKGVFILWDDPVTFNAVRVGASGDVVWGDEVELCPDALYLRLTDQQPEDPFPRLRELAEYARD